MKFLSIFAAALLSALLLAGCSSSNTVSSADPEADFSLLRTYGFVEIQNDEGRTYESLEVGYLRAAVNREMEARGYELSSEPDVVINFSIETEDKIRSRQVPRSSYGVGYDPYYDAYYDDWGMTHETQIDQYVEGKLNIDVIDPDARNVVWQGSTSGRLTKKDYENVEVTLNNAVTEIFTQFPVPAPK